MSQQPIRAEHRLERETFRTSRLLDFCSARELTKQIGHSVDQWPLVTLKELVDNALDAAEEFGIAPAIQAEVADGAIIITTSLIASDGRGDGWATMTARRRTISH